MDVREKLVELLNDVQETGVNEIPAGFGCTREYIANEKVASHLTANGVTVQEWTSVDDEFPEIGGYVVCIAKRNPFSMFMPMVARIEKNGWVNPITEQYISEVTYWMPLPKPPKES